jgi:hypothetical protein
MCDCYNHQCNLKIVNGKTCLTNVPMHLGDFDTGRNEVLVFCNRHYKQARKYPNYTIFQYRKLFYGVVYLTNVAVNNRFHNHPNDSNYNEIERDWKVNE